MAGKLIYIYFRSRDDEAELWSRQTPQYCVNFPAFWRTKMEFVYAVFASLLSILITASAAVDVTLENDDDIIHSPFSEGTGNDAHGLHGYKVFTKEELSQYNGENVSTSVSWVVLVGFSNASDCFDLPCKVIYSLIA